LFVVLFIVIFVVIYKVYALIFLQDIITMEDTLGLLKSAITKDCLNKFAVAGDLSSTDQISKEDMAQYLCEEIMTAVSKGHMQGKCKQLTY
jgi:hypothetical protein